MEKQKTTYRSKSNGYNNFLQYNDPVRLLFGLIVINRWKYIWQPYYDNIYERTDIDGSKTFVNSYSRDLKGFIEQYPFIEEYFKWAKKEQARLEKKAENYWKEINEKRGEITML